ncbi:anthocyanidin 5,3-O-glucosyltransferase-like [Phalaenopsis equestris]|uniref:anthocyanidin 5,3-O-glucosyltransferase-like n=1 Tax=Phalaenopsis equestris TaxID=78828 RepID=UPI0009E6583C|nr:anthocyanidin 5,3-O-glucosyltransferase-like [Phalaenopsis equestris]
MEKNDALALLPLGQMGHIVPMIELAKRLLHHGLSIHIFLLQLPFLNNHPINSYISNIKSSHPSISFHHLPIITLPSLSPTPLDDLVQTLKLSVHHLLRHLHSSSCSFRALIVDFLCGPIVCDIVEELQLPLYIFCPINASALSALLYVPTLLSQSDTKFDELGDAPLHLAGLSYPIPASYFPEFMFDRTNEASKEMLASFALVPKLAKGVLLNSFEALEPHVIHGVANGLCFSSFEMTPIYCVGPITRSRLASEPRHESLVWLDEQPSGSVVFLSFGSLGAFPEAQLREIAIGLERSGQRFLWIVRGPPVSGGVKGGVMPWTEPDLKTLMPDRFEERTRERGILVRSWAPQVELLEHEAVGGFVTHCGWNSVLEAWVAGVAMIAWPLYAEQKMNKLFLVEEAEVAIEMRGDENGFVVAEEVEERVRWLMDSQGGRELSRKVEDVGKKARDAIMDGGTSHAAMIKMLQCMRGGEEDGGRQH